jgi:alcohol dehydrogenase class IV
MSIASSMAMNAVAMNGAGMAHFLNPQIGKKTGTPHGEACILMLPHTMEFNLIACPERFARIAELMGERIEGLHIMDAAKKAIGVVKQISKDVGMPQTLTEIGISKDDITEMVDATLENFQSRIKAKNPRPATREDIIGIYSAAL